MRKILFVLTGILLSLNLVAQSPQAFKYQAVVRDNSGALLTEQSVNFQVDIIKGSVEGSAVYSESHTALTNAFGLVTLEIGKGTTTDDFAAIEWGGDSYFITLWINGEEMGTVQLLSVPYALHSRTAETIIVDGQIKNVADPTDDQDVATKAYVDSQITNPGVRIAAEVDSVVCFGVYNGAIDLTVTGGTPPYIFEWDNGSTTEDLTGITHGKYQVYVEDSNGLTAFRHFTLHAPEEIDIDYTVTPGSGDIDITVSGGTPPYSYLWSTGSTEEDLTGLEDGAYTVTVTDAAGCSVIKQIEILSDESLSLVEYLESADSPYGKYYVNTDLPSLRTAEMLHTLIQVDKVYIIDIRSPETWAAGHIEGAVNLSSEEVPAHFETEDLSAYDEICIVCYTGMVSSWLTSLLRLDGYDNVYALKWGMCSWHADFASSWQANISNDKATFFVSDASSKGPEGDLPVLSTGFNTPEEILDARLDVVLAEGFGAAAIPVSSVYADLDNYYIINYWPEADYVSMGHIEGAIQYTPKADIALDAALKTLPTNKTIVVYDYTGQVSSPLVAYLRLIGYDAKSLKFGANAMIYDEMTKSKWSEAAIMDYDYVVE